jgi:dihydroorotase
MKRHPSGATTTKEREPSEARPYRAFMDALEELEMVVSLHGTASTEADIMRANVRRLREVAADAWRTRAA